jgi:hypothetical protein
VRAIRTILVAALLVAVAFAQQSDASLFGNLFHKRPAPSPSPTPVAPPSVVITQTPYPTPTPFAPPLLTPLQWHKPSSVPSPRS